MNFDLYKFGVCRWNSLQEGNKQVLEHHIFWQQSLEARSPGHTLVFNIWDDVGDRGWSYVTHTTMPAPVGVQSDPVYGIPGAWWAQTGETDIMGGGHGWILENCSMSMKQLSRMQSSKGWCIAVLYTLRELSRIQT